MERDTVIFDLIKKECQRQKEGIELIASENFVSDEVMEAMGSCLTNKYAEGYPGARYYGGCQIVDQTEQLAIDRACKLFGAEYANVQPHSGAQANAAVFFACMKPGDTYLGLDLAHGGHLSHGSPVNLSGINYKPIAYHVKEDTGLVDYDEMERLALEHKPKMIVSGASAYSRDWDYKRMREIADKVGAILMYDMAHPAGLIAKGLLNNPFEYCHIVTTTTHKTLRGPRGGMILLPKDFPNPWGHKSSIVQYSRDSKADRSNMSSQLKLLLSKKRCLILTPNMQNKCRGTQKFWHKLSWIKDIKWFQAVQTTIAC